MKAIIDGKLYDTETATELARWIQPERTTILFRTAKGADFLSIERHTHSPYIRPDRIVPVENDEYLLALTIKYGGVDEALRLFPKRIETA